MLIETQNQNRVYVDRDPTIFRHLIDFLSLGSDFPEIKDDRERQLFKHELKFWGIFISNELTAYEQKLQDIFDSEPVGVHPEVLKTWRKIGPFSLAKMKANLAISLDESVPLEIGVEKKHKDGYYDG